MGAPQPAAEPLLPLPEQQRFWTEILFIPQQAGERAGQPRQCLGGAGRGSPMCRQACKSLLVPQGSSGIVQTHSPVFLCRMNLFQIPAVHFAL